MATFLRVPEPGASRLPPRASAAAGGQAQSPRPAGDADRLRASWDGMSRIPQPTRHPAASTTPAAAGARLPPSAFGPTTPWPSIPPHCSMRSASSSCPSSPRGPQPARIPAKPSGIRPPRLGGYFKPAPAVAAAAQGILGAPLAPAKPTASAATQAGPGTVPARVLAQECPVYYNEPRSPQNKRATPAASLSPLVPQLTAFVYLFALEI